MIVGDNVVVVSQFGELVGQFGYWDIDGVWDMVGLVFFVWLYVDQGDFVGFVLLQQFCMGDCIFW